MIPLHLPPGDTSTERTLQIDGTSEQIEIAKQLVNEVSSEVCSVVAWSCAAFFNLLQCVVLLMKRKVGTGLLPFKSIPTRKFHFPGTLAGLGFKQATQLI